MFWPKAKVTLARMSFLVLPIVLLALAACSFEALSPQEQAQSIDRRLMCPVCPAETIDQSQADLAIQMRELVREKLRAGETESEILDFFVDRYGTSVLAEPPAEGFNILVWIVPPLALVGGLALVLLGVRQLGVTTRPLPASEGSDWESESESYLREIDREFHR